MVGVLSLGTACSLLLGSGVTHSEKQSGYKSFLQDNASIQFEHLNYEDTYKLWSENAIGNSPNALLSGGKLYKDNDVAVFPENNGSGVTVCRTAFGETTIEGGISFINRWNNDLFYRDDSTRNIMQLRLGDDKPTLYQRGNIGEVFVTNDNLYYIDYASGYCLKSRQLDSKDSTVVFNEPIQTFVIVGAKAICLTATNNLCSYDMETDSTVEIVRNIERFFFIGGDMVAEANNTVFSFEPNGNHAKEIYSSNAESFCVIGANEDYIYACEDGDLTRISRTEMAKEILANGSYDSIDSLIESAGEIMAIAYNDKTGKTAASKLISISSSTE